MNCSHGRRPQAYSDLVCTPGVQFCNPSAHYSYIAINTALSQCCWLDGCPKSKATTCIAGTAFDCATGQTSGSANVDSSNCCRLTQWPIKLDEEFWLTFCVYDTGDGVFDSEVILEGLQFGGPKTAGAWTTEPM